MIIRPVETKDVGNFFRMLCLLDEETEYMMYEPGERRAKTPDLKRLTASVEATASEADLLLAAENETGKVEECVDKIHALLQSEHMKTARNNTFIKELKSEAERS